MNLWMPIFGVSLLICALVALNMFGWPRIVPGASAPSGSVSILIPARNEEKFIGRALDSALADTGAVLEALVYDDHSTDDTAKLVLDRAAHDPRIRLVTPQPLPEGWCGKPFACARLAAEARGDWFLFLDADVVLLPRAVDAIVAEAIHRRTTFLSCWPGLVMVGFWEKVFMPMLNFVVFTLFPTPISMTSKKPALGLAHGACILTLAETYRQIGG
ncbi:MAG: glycosyltransferase family A protein, partial [Kiritimatiellia bacterium]|nr:glycosyltransferase family A protein [Kiritimatiellia bacterium]